jgi:hypothetical protein
VRQRERGNRKKELEQRRRKNTTPLNKNAEKVPMPRLNPQLKYEKWNW